MRNSAKWLEWISYNLAYGINQNDIIDELIENEFTEVEATTLVNSVKNNPLYTTLKRLSLDIRKGTDLNDVLLDLKLLNPDYNFIERKSLLTEKEFLLNYYCRNEPVIITDISSKWEAIEKWTLEYLVDNFGEEEISYQIRDLKYGYKSAFIKSTTKGTFGEYIDLITKHNREDVYLIAHDNLLSRPKFRRLLEDVVFDERYLDAQNYVGQTFFWLGPRSSRTPMHRDLGNVWLTQILGRKKIKLVPPTQYHLIYNDYEYYSEIDFEDIDYDNFPLAKKLQISEVIVNPGEVLFIPLGWWHDVKSLDITISLSGYNFKFQNKFKPIFE